jgi:hypothetical protein
MMLRGGGSAYSTTVKPAVDVALRACGMLGTFSATPTPNWVYTPKSTGFEAVTCYVMNEYGPTVKLTGAFGSGQIMFSMGRPVIMRVTLQGIYTTETDTPTIVTKAVSTSPAWPTFLNAAAVWGAYSPVLANASLNFGNSLDVIESANNAAGIAGVIFGTRRPSGSIDPAVTVRGASGFDFIADWEAATPRLVAWGTNGVQYQRCKVEAPRAVIRSRPWIARGTKAAWQLGFDCTPNLGDDDYKITFD